MHKRFLQFQAYHKRSRHIIILFRLDMLFLLLILLSVTIRIKYSYPLAIIFTVTDILLLIFTVRFLGKNLIIVKDLEDYFISKSYETSVLRVLQFHKLMDKNLFNYYFQPIINTRTGEIFGYEALMRTDHETIGLFPDEILDFAAKENRLYEIEKYTFFNILKIMSENPEIFQTKKLFINSISSHQLTNNDYNKLSTTYSSLLENVVQEITESTNLSEANLKLIHNRLKNSNCQLALDDYGTGYSNESNLLNSSPNYVKIDRSILRNINIDSKKQNLVFNLVSFAKQNHFKVIAEGIETYEEFEYVINLGVDFIQGYYTAKPDPVLIQKLPEEIIQKIQKINIRKLSENSSDKAYEADSDEILIPIDIASDMYSSIVINKKELILRGSGNIAAEIPLIIPDNHRCRLTLENLNLKGVNKPSISIGKNSSVELVLKGDNYISEDGIRVPESSDLIITGDGNLTISIENINKVCIGGASDQTYGNITLAAKGTINVTSRSNESIAIGGGQNPSNSIIRLITGNIFVESLGNKSVGIGSIAGNARVLIEDCILKVETEGTKSVGIGSITGYVDIINFGKLDLNCEGKNVVCIGAVEADNGLITLRGGVVNVCFRTHLGSGIGSLTGKQNIEIYNGELSIKGEGTELVALGDPTNCSIIRIMNGILSILLHAVDAKLTGNQPHKLIIDGGNIQCDFPEESAPVNSYGTPLVSHIITDKDEFHQIIENVSYSYEYRASYSDRFPYIKIYLPDNTIYTTF